MANVIFYTLNFGLFFKLNLPICLVIKRLYDRIPDTGWRKKNTRTHKNQNSTLLTFHIIEVLINLMTTVIQLYNRIYLCINHHALFLYNKLNIFFRLNYPGLVDWHRR